MSKPGRSSINDVEFAMRTWWDCASGSFCGVVFYPRVIQSVGVVTSFSGKRLFVVTTNLMRAHFRSHSDLFDESFKGGLKSRRMYISGMLGLCTSSSFFFLLWFL